MELMEKFNRNHGDRFGLVNNETLFIRSSDENGYQKSLMYVDFTMRTVEYVGRAEHSSRIMTFAEYGDIERLRQFHDILIQLDGTPPDLPENMQVTMNKSRMNLSK